MEPEFLSRKWNACILRYWRYLLVPHLVAEKEWKEDGE